MNELGILLIPATLNPVGEEENKILLENAREIIWSILNINNISVSTINEQEKSID